MMEPTSESTPETVPAPETQPEQASWWEDIVDVYLSPGELFERRSDASWKRPALMLIALSLVLYVVLLPANTIIMQAAMAQNPEAAGAMEQWSGLFHLFGAVMIPIMVCIMIVFNGAIVWLGSKLVGAALGFGRAVVIATFALYTMLPEQIVGGIMVLLRRGEPIDPQTDLSLGALMLVDAEAMSPAVIALLGQLDLFSLWFAALIAVGVHVVARVEWGKAAVVAGLVWLLGIIPGLLGAMSAGA